jgi:glycosyltransferase involved in cell wall biosynthesis
MKMEHRPEISVIIPTYNRAAFLLEVLNSLAQQSLPASRFEVIVVDDGSDKSIGADLESHFPFTLRYIYQENRGDAEARNTGAAHSHADLLVFLDDDVLVGRDYLTALVKGHEEAGNRIIVGTQILWIEEGSPPLDRPVKVPGAQPGDQDLSAIKFSEVCSNNMSVRKESYESIGMMESLNFRGSSMWCDVDFSYRAYLKGIGFYRSTEAVCWHRDYVSLSLENQKRRWREVAYRAVALFAKYPQLAKEIPMFVDKTPVDWHFDSPGLILRKITRHITSSRFVMWPLGFSEKTLAGMGISGGISRNLQRWIIGGCIFQGFREGLRAGSNGSAVPLSGLASE